MTPDNPIASTGVSPAPSSSAKPADSAVSPGAGPAPSGQPAATEAEKELRRTVTRLGEENKKLRAFYEKASTDPGIQRILRGETPQQAATAQPEDDGLTALAQKVWTEGDAGTLAEVLRKAVTMAEERTAKRVREEFEPFVRRQISSTVASKMDQFFGPQGKNLPDMAQPTSEFSQFLALEARSQPWFANLLDQDLDAAFDVAWTRYTRANGDPAAERQKRLEVERRKAASLEDATGLPAQAMGIAEPGGKKTLLQIFNELAERGL